jgi:hypothetical protein
MFSDRKDKQKITKHPKIRMHLFGAEKKNTSHFLEKEVWGEAA